MLNEDTITEPSLLLHYCRVLVSQLVDAQYHCFTFPIYSLAQYISEHILDSRALVTLNHLHLARMFDQLNMVDLSVKHLNLASPVLPTESEMHTYSEDLEQREQLNKLSQSNANGTGTATASSDPSRAASRAQGQNTATEKVILKEEDMDAVDSSAFMLITKTPQIRHIWLQTANLLLGFGQMAPAKILLTQAHAHCQAYHDEEYLALVRRALGEVALLEGNASLAMDLEYAAMAKRGLPNYWVTGVKNLLRALPWAYSGALVHNINTEALGLLQYTLAEFQGLLNTPEIKQQAQQPLDVVRAVSKVQNMLGEYYFDKAIPKTLWFFSALGATLVTITNLT